MTTISELRIFCFLAELCLIWMIVSTVRSGELSINGLFKITKLKDPVKFYGLCFILFVVISTILYSIYL
jgi:hypothetical protein